MYNVVKEKKCYKHLKLHSKVTLGYWINGLTALTNFCKLSYLSLVPNMRYFRGDKELSPRLFSGDLFISLDKFLIVVSPSRSHQKMLTPSQKPSSISSLTVERFDLVERTFTNRNNQLRYCSSSNDSLALIAVQAAVPDTSTSFNLIPLFKRSFFKLFHCCSTIFHFLDSVVLLFFDRLFP